MNTKKIFFTILCLCACAFANISAQEKAFPKEKDMSSYLLVYFKDDTHGLYFALSDDGYTFTDVNGGNPVIAGDTIAQENPGGIKMAFSDKINSGYVYQSGQIDFEPRSCEAPNVWKRIGEDKWVVMYDIFSIQPHNFGFAETTDFEHFTHLGHFDEGVMRRTNFEVQKHGAVIQLTKEEADQLTEYYKNKTNSIQ
jgi:hypothetical protein